MDKEIRKINILELHSSLDFGGGQRNLFAFCKYLNKDIFNVFAGAYRVGGSFEKKLFDLGIKYVVSNNPDQIGNFIKANHIDIIHIHRSGHYVKIETAIINMAKRLNPNIVIIEKNVFGKCDPVSGKEIDVSFFQSMMNLNERFLPASGLAFDFDRMKVLYNIVDIEEFKKYRLSPEKISALKARWGIGSGDFVIGKIGRSYIAKWSDLVIKSMPYLVMLVPNVKYVLVGVPASRRKLIGNSRYKDKFIILDETNDESAVHAFYQVIDVLGHSSKIGEANGNAINEAMFWKKPVVVNSTPRKDNGQLEQVVHMATGIIANHPQTYARALFHLYKNPKLRVEMGLRAFNKIIGVNNPGSITAQFEKTCVKELINKGFYFRPETVDYYNKIEYYPTGQNIADYRERYKKILASEFGNLSYRERLINFIRMPVNFYYKILDFIEHRFGL